MRRLLIGTLGGALLLLSLSMPAVLAAQDDATPPASASPSPEGGVTFLLPTEAQVPDGLVMISDGERTLDDVASGFSDPLATAEQFMDWGWRGNIVRAFHVPSGTTSDQEAIDGIYVSVHEFGSPEFAAEALDYSFEAHIADTTLLEVGLRPLGDYSRALYGRLPYGNEVTIYIQQGNYLIRLSAASPNGDPRVEATALVQSMLDLQTATPIAALRARSLRLTDS
jgi:hypothetical protein